MPIGSSPSPAASRISPQRAEHDGGFRPPALVTIRSPILLFQDRRQPLEQLGKVGHIAGVLVPGPEMAQDRHRQLGEVLERQHVDLAVASEQKGRIEIVAPEAGAVADAEWFSHRIGSVRMPSYSHSLAE